MARRAAAVRLNPSCVNKNWVETIWGLPQNAQAGIAFTLEEVDPMLGISAQRTLGV
jgi:hypothetical protein